MQFHDSQSRAHQCVVAQRTEPPACIRRAISEAVGGIGARDGIQHQGRVLN